MPDQPDQYTLTVGQLRDALAGVPDETPVARQDHFGDPVFYTTYGQRYLERETSPAYFSLDAPDIGEAPD